VDEVMFEGRLRETNSNYNYERDKNVINGLPNYYLDLHKNLPLQASNFAYEEVHGNVRHIKFKNFTPGSVCVLRSAHDDDDDDDDDDTHRHRHTHTHTHIYHTCTVFTIILACSLRQNISCFHRNVFWKCSPAHKGCA
jgi:hypothetical protein